MVKIMELLTDDTTFSHAVIDDPIPHAIIIFVDIRGFTKWSTHTEVSRYLGKFIREFNKILKGTFANAFVKPLGDGAMIIELIPIPESVGDVMDLCKNVLEKIRTTSEKFAQMCESFTISLGHTTALNLGWGVTRGLVNVIDDPLDYVGMNVNLASRLCGLARPCGIVIDREDFSLMPPMDDYYTFVQAEQKVKGIDEAILLWITNDVRLDIV